MSNPVATTPGHVGLSIRMHGDYCANLLRMQAMPPTWKQNILYHYLDKKISTEKNY